MFSIVHLPYLVALCRCVSFGMQNARVGRGPEGLRADVGDARVLMGPRGRPPSEPLHL
eukprot:COSAG03_NODE_1511_length_3952_cov_10.484817_7_plen_58_part_00